MDFTKDMMKQIVSAHKLNSNNRNGNISRNVNTNGNNSGSHRQADAVHIASVSIPASLTASAGTYLRTPLTDLKTMLCANLPPTLNPAEGARGKRASGNQEKSISVK